MEGGGKGLEINTCGGWRRGSPGGWEALEITNICGGGGGEGLDWGGARLPIPVGGEGPTLILWRKVKERGGEGRDHQYLCRGEASSLTRG